MKKTIFFLFSVTTFASASVVTVSNIADEMTSAVLLDNTATPILSGDAFIHIGFFGDVASEGADPTNFVSTFTTFTSGAISNSLAGGFLEQNFDGPTLNQTSPFVGEGVSVIVTDAADLASSTAFAAFSTGSTFAADVQSINNATPTAGLLTANAVFGVTESGSFEREVPSPFGTQIQTFESGVALTAVPEPSAALLAGLALVGGLVRRRR